METTQTISTPWHQVRPYQPAKKEDLFELSAGKSTSDKTKNAFIGAANSLVPAYNEITTTKNRTFTYTLVGNNLPRAIMNGITHEANISKSPIAYLKDTNYSIARKVFDLVLLGPVAAVADTVSGIAFTLIKVLFLFVKGGKAVYHLAKGNKSDAQMCYSHVKNTLKYMATSLPKELLLTALRIVPVAGVFLSFGVRVLITGGAMKVDEAIENRYERRMLAQQEAMRSTTQYTSLGDTRD